MTKRFSWGLAALVTLCLSACGGVGLPADRVSFDPISFFEGHTHGEGELRKLFARPVRVSVDSTGRPAPDGLIVDQVIREAGKPPSSRRWVIHRVAQNRYSGTLTDAVGPVTAEVRGSRAQIDYPMRHDLDVQQQLAEQPGGTSLLNRLTVRKFGLRVATLTETITKSGR